MRNIGILTSGGDAPGMNAAIRAVTRSALKEGLRVFGIKRGYNGLINGELFEMNRGSVSDIIQRGGTILKTARSEEFKTKEGREKANKVLKRFNIDSLVVLGGDGSLNGAKVLSEEFNIDVFGIPCTIDNDIGYTDFSIGFDTAINTVVDIMNKLRDTSASHERVSVIEVMGRNCGDIALNAGIAGGAESVIIPELEFDFNKLCESVVKTKTLGKLHYIVVIAEGAGSAQDIVGKIQDTTGVEATATVPGYIQRGGSPSAFDRLIATKFGSEVIKSILENRRNILIGIKDNKILSRDISDGLSQEKSINKNIYKIANELSI